MREKAHYYFGLALLMHLLLLFIFSFMRNDKSIYEEKSEHYIPAYVLQETRKISLPPILEKNQHQTSSKNGLEKNKKSANFKQQNIQVSSSAKSQQMELTPEKNINKPLLKILHDTTAANLIYPAIAIEFKQTGTVTLAFFIQPNGMINKVRILKSSGSEILDNAAIEAVKAISPVKNVSLYLPETKYLAVDIVFR